MSTKRLTIFDTTLRDGEQAPGLLAAHRREAHDGPPARGARRGRHRSRVPDRLGGGRRSGPAGRDARPRAGHRRAGPLHRRPTSIARAGRSSRRARRRIHIFIATSDLHLERKLRMTREACLDAAVAAVHRARRYTDDVQFSAEDATRSDMDFLCRVVEEVISAGCTTVNLPDTVGYSTPDEIGDVLPDDPVARARTRATPRSARTATTTSASRWRTPWRRSPPARRRWSARSTASASAPATRRSKRS